MADGANQPRDCGGRHRIVLDDWQWIVLHVHVEPREASPRSADEIERQALPLPCPARLLEQLGDSAVARTLALGAQRRDPQDAALDRHALAHLALLHAHPL